MPHENASWLCGLCIPEPYRVILATGREQPAIGAEAHAPDRGRVSGEGAFVFPRARIPKPRCVILATGREQPAIGAEVHAPDLRGVPPQDVL